MKALLWILPLLVLGSCSSKKPEVTKEKACSALSMNYLKSPKNKGKVYLRSDAAVKALSQTQAGIQACYEDFKKRRGHKEFDACLVVGVDQNRKTDFFHFYSNDKKVDEKFISCGAKVTSAVPFFNLGRNFVLVQTYSFYED